MQVIKMKYPLTNDDITQNNKDIVLAIGQFDGVHMGHREVIGQAVRAAYESGRQAAVMTFDPHPKAVLGRVQQGNGYLLTGLADKLEIFAEIGVDVVYVLSFDREFAAVSPTEFVQEVLRPLGVVEVVVGFDFTFGSRGAGTPEMLRQLAPDMQVHIVPELLYTGEKVSSTRIRLRVEAGDISAANTLLGAPYRMHGTVVHGEGRGATIGFPTANIAWHDSYIIPAIGIYAVTVKHLDTGKTYGGMLSIGLKPTFHENLAKPEMEVNIFDYSGDLYDSEIEVTFIAHMRPEVKFAGVQELVEQLAKDAVHAREILRKEAR